MVESNVQAGPCAGTEWDTEVIGFVVGSVPVESTQTRTGGGPRAASYNKVESNVNVKGNTIGVQRTER